MREIHALMLSLVTLFGQQSPQPADAAKLPNENVGRVGQSGVTAPRLIKETKPNYTAAAMRARIQGVVTLECVVELDGTVGSVRVIRSLDANYGLDGEAMKALKAWRFVPGMKDGVPVRVLVTIEMSFTLREHDGSTPASTTASAAVGPDLPAPLAWPELFAAASNPSVALPAGWIEDSLAAATIGVQYAYPPKWSILKSEDANRFVTAFADDSDGVRAFTIFQQPSQFTLSEPVSQATLDGFTVGARAGAAFANLRPIGSGQVLRQGGLWIWFEMSAPSFASWNAPAGLSERLRTGSYDGIHVWTFTTTSEGQSVNVFCTLVHRANISDAEKQEQIRRASLEFGSILKSIVILKR